VGETFDVPESTFRVRVDDFTIETTPEGQVKDYKSVLTVLDPDSVLTKTIEVNHPLVYKGIDFYQSSYGQESGRVRAALLQIQGGGPEPVEQSLEVLWGTRQPVPGTNLAVEIRGFVPDFVMDLNTGEVTTRSREARNPAVRIAVYEGEHLLYDEWVFAASRGMHPSMGRPYNFRLLDFAPQLYTGLQISHNPALPLVYIGFLAMSFGLFLSFYLSHRRLWVLIWQEKGKTRSLVGGNANKGTLGLEREIEKMAREMEK
jgi:cytochrome c biogenesis protein